MPDAFSVEGHVLSGGRFFFGHVMVEDKSAVAIGEGEAPVAPLATGIVLPGLLNGHTHVGDAAVPAPPPQYSPAQVFAPPDGYKHRMLESLPREQLEGGITSFLDRVTETGTVQHVDFREGGVAGVELLRNARRGATHAPRSRVFGRPARQAFDRREMEALSSMVDGIGLSAVADWSRGPLQDVVAAIRDLGLPLALHCSESRHEELSPTLDLGPEFLVHMAFGTSQDFRDLAAAGVAVVVCPRSTHRFTRAPPVMDMLREGVSIRVGTDNAMLQGPSVLDEVAFLLSLPENRDLDPLEALSWALPPAKGSNTGGDFGVSTGCRDLAVLTFDGSDPIEFLRGSKARVAELVMTDGRVWRK